MWKSFQLVEEHAARVEQLQADLRRLTGQKIMALGHEIEQAHAKLEKKYREGTFRKWLRIRLKVSHTTAYRWLRVYQRFKTCNNLGQICPSALYKLAENTTPYELAKKAMELAAQGKVVTHKMVKRWLEAKHYQDHPEAEEDQPERERPERTLTAFERLKRAWKKATTADKAKFRRWLQNHEGCDLDNVAI